MAALRHLALILGLISFTLAVNACPPDEIGSPCKCKQAIVTCENISDTSTLLKGIQYYKGYNIYAVILMSLKLPYLPAGLFLGTSFKVLMIKFSDLDNLYSTTDYTPSPFAGLEDSLEKFVVISTKSPSNWYFPDMKGFKQLKQVAIVDSPLNFVSHFFAEIGEGSLEKITVSSSKVNRIHPQAFPELTNLKEVNFRGNFLPYMVRTMFPTPASQLKHIDLSKNKLFTLPENMFDNMPVLEYLNLSENDFKVFQNMPVYSSLQYFFISNNPFECDCHLLPLKQLSTSNLKSDIDMVDCETTFNIKIPLRELSSDDMKCY